MRFFLRFLLILSILLPSAPLRASVMKPAEDCPICGHVCCCPEICALKIREMRSVKSCSSNSCKMSAGNSRAMTNSKDSLIRPEPDPRTLSFTVPSVDLRHERVRSLALGVLLSPTLEILTPPPRLAV